MKRLDRKDKKILQLEEEVKRLKGIIAWQSKSMAGLNPKKLTFTKK